MRKVEKTMELDPVCGMTVDPKTAAGKSEYQGKAYYFCSLGCKAAFDKDPERFLNSKGHTHEHMHHH